MRDQNGTKRKKDHGGCEMTLSHNPYGYDGFDPHAYKTERQRPMFIMAAWVVHHDSTPKVTDKRVSIKDTYGYGCILRIIAVHSTLFTRYMGVSSGIQ